MADYQGIWRSTEAEDWFDRAAIAGDVSRMTSLLQTGVDVNRVVHATDGQTALHIAAFENDPAMIRLLLRHDADKTRRDGRGQIALEIAREYRFEELIALLEDGAGGPKT